MQFQQTFPLYKWGPFIKTAGKLKSYVYPHLSVDKMF